jgi:polyhydroxybutyrate depolymerase
MSRRAIAVRSIAFFALVTLVMVAVACRDPSGSGAPSAGASEAASSQSSTVPFDTGTTHGSLAYGGLTRTYRLYVPPQAKSAKSGSLPLVVALHGGLGSGDQFAETSRFEDLARQEGFVVVFPDGVDRTWNGGRCCGRAVATGVDDSGFLADLIATLSKSLPIDPSRVFMTGHSNGAIMAFRFGCEHAGLVAAVAPVAGSLEIASCRPSRGVSLLAIHGDADQNHPIGGGNGSRSISGVPFTSMDDSLRAWTGAMTCSPNATRATSGPLTTTDWTHCRDGVTTRYIIVAGADHPWPGSADRRASALQGEPSQALDATAAVWAFFRDLPRR